MIVAQETSNQLTTVLPTEFLRSVCPLATFYNTSENYYACISERKFSALREAFLRVAIALVVSRGIRLQTLRENIKHLDV